MTKFEEHQEGHVFRHVSKYNQKLEEVKGGLERNEKEKIDLLQKLIKIKYRE